MPQPSSFKPAFLSYQEHAYHDCHELKKVEIGFYMLQQQTGCNQGMSKELQRTVTDPIGRTSGRHQERDYWRWDRADVCWDMSVEESLPESYRDKASGSLWAAVLESRDGLGYPADLYVEAYANVQENDKGVVFEVKGGRKTKLYVDELSDEFVVAEGELSFLLGFKVLKLASVWRSVQGVVAQVCSVLATQVSALIELLELWFFVVHYKK
ncbi:hypothetical protein Tco_0116578 [Tanacetum coccineum]